MSATTRRRKGLLVLAVLAFVGIVFWAWPRDGEATPGAVVPERDATQLAAGGSSEQSLLPPGAHPSDRGSAIVPVASPEARTTTSPGPALRGRVIDDLGKAVTQFRLDLREPSAAWSTVADQYINNAPLLTDARGEFELSELPPGEWSIAAWRPSGARSAPRTFAVPNAGTQVELMVPRDATLRGSVLDATDRPVEGAEILRAVGVQFETVDHERTAVAARTKASGAFAIEAIPAGPQRLMARREGYCESEWTEVALEPGGSSQVILRMREGGRIEGHVDPSRAQTAGREIMLFSFRGSLGWRSTRSNANGRFVIEDVIPQAYVVELRALEHATTADGSQGSVRKNIQVEAGKTTEVILGEVKQEIAVRGVVMLAGSPAAGFNVHAMPTDGAEDRNARATSDARGKFELAVAGEGEYAFVVSRDQGSTLWVPRRISGPGPVDVVLELPGGSIRGTVRSPEGKALARVPVTVIRPAEAGEDPRRDFMRRFARTKTDANGQFELGLLSPGTYTLRAPDGFQDDSPPDRTPFGHVVVPGITIEGSSHEPLEIVMAAEGFVAGRVLDSAGTPIAEAWLMIVDSDGRGTTARYTNSTDNRGSFEFFSVAPGAYTMSVIKGEARVSSAVFVVTEGKTSTVEVTLP